MIFDRHANLKYKYGGRSFWCRGYYVDTVTHLYGHYFVLMTMAKVTKTARDFLRRFNERTMEKQGVFCDACGKKDEALHSN